MENLQNLREINLSFNKIVEINEIKNMTNLVSLRLDGNQIKRIKCIKGMRKLELLSLSWNQIADIAHVEFGEPLLELKEINLSHNQLT